MKRGCLTVVAVLVGLVAVLVVARVVLNHRETRHPAALPEVALPSGTSAIAADTLLFDSDRTGNYEIFDMPAGGGAPRQLTHDPAYDTWWARISPDRTRVLFYRTPAGTHDRDFTKTALWMMNADGSEPRLVLPSAAYGWAQQGHAEWSPDGTHLVMFGGQRSRPQIFVTDNLGRHPRQVTDRSGTNIDPAWSPDGRTIVFVGCPRALCFSYNYEIFTIPVAGGSATRITDDRTRDQDPYFSPDGRRIAWLSQTGKNGPAGEWNIRIADANGSHLGAVTRDDNINSKPQWSGDGHTIFFHRFVYSGTRRFGIWAIGADGTGLREVTTGQPGNNEYPSI